MTNLPQPTILSNKKPLVIMIASNVIGMLILLNILHRMEETFEKYSYHTYTTKIIIAIIIAIFYKMTTSYMVYCLLNNRPIKNQWVLFIIIGIPYILLIIYLILKDNNIK
jgi:H+/Cl- antiporter ClcA